MCARLDCNNLKLQPAFIEYLELVYIKLFLFRTVYCIDQFYDEVIKINNFAMDDS